MPEITEQTYSVRLQSDSPISHPYRPRRDLHTMVTGTRVDITYKRAVTDNTHIWYLDLGGSYPLHTPKPVCECSPDVLKSRQGAHVRIGYPYAQDAAHVPVWAYRLVQEHAPDWFSL